MDENTRISAAFKKRLGADYSVDTRVNYFQYDTDEKAEASFDFVVKNPLIESNPQEATKQIFKALGELEPLKPYLKLESQTNHMERLATELTEFRAAELKVNEKNSGEAVTHIHDKWPEWFRELPKRSGWNIQHALNVTKANTGIISISINTPKDVSQDDIVKNIHDRKTDILAMLAERVEKYTPTAKTPEEKVMWLQYSGQLT